MSKRTRRTVEVPRGAIGAANQSGLDDGEFCRRRGIHRERLRRWRERLSEAGTTETPPQFVELVAKPTGEPAACAKVEVVLTNGRRVRAPLATPVSTIARLVAALDAPCSR